MELNDQYYEMVLKNLISVQRISRSEQLSELIRSTKAEHIRDTVEWMDFWKVNKN